MMEFPLRRESVQEEQPYKDRIARRLDVSLALNLLGAPFAKKFITPAQSRDGFTESSGVINIVVTSNVCPGGATLEMRKVKLGCTGRSRRWYNLEKTRIL